MWSKTLEVINPAEQIYQALLKEKKELISAMKVIQKYKGWSDEKTIKEIEILWRER